MADDVVRLRVEFEGVKTQTELERLARTVRQLRKDSDLDSQKALQAGKLEADIKNKLHAANTLAYSDNAKMKESYFKLGTEIRSMRMASLQTASALGLDKGALGAALSALASPGGILAGAVTAGALWVKNLHDQAMEATAATLAIDKYSAKLATFKKEKLALGGPQQEVAGLLFAAKTPEEQAKILGERVRGYEAQGYDKPLGAMTNLTLLGKAKMYGRQADYLRDKAALRELQKQEPESEMRLRIEAQAYDRDRKRTRFYPTQRAFRSIGGRGTGTEEFPGVDTGQLAMDEMNAAFAAMNEADRKAAEVSEGMMRIKDAAMEAGQAIESSIVGALTKALGVGNDLAGQLLGIALRLGIGLAVGAITGGVGAGAVVGGGTMLAAKGGIIPEPVFGIGKSGRGYIFGEAGPERVTPMVGRHAGGGDSMAMAVRQLAHAVSNGVWRVQGTELVYATNAGQRVLNSRSM